MQTQFPIEPIQFVYGAIAVCGGIARYLTGYANGRRFTFTIFLASAFTAGFSGWMFALMGITLGLPQTWIFMMAGVGGFAGEQTMKFLMEYVTKKLS